MKNIMMSLVLVLTTIGFTASAETSPSTPISPEASMVLVSDLYAKEVAELSKNAHSIGKNLVLTDISLLKIGETSTKTYVYFHFSIVKTDGDLEPLGSLVGIVHSMNGGLFLEKIYFVGIATPPGGVTVGN